ncbi:hypothetical protein CKAN_00457100 [Cinnamomum micranthum f. kanehirae]|uniref:Uncharacterized protein n=1 Tax=Cinnamomum micranthum f. kanehirae TaxID=337451 RepID=A0A443NC96_9MAGN|nr:hypothetical protein CKAN_00457100 [Cinnamomum micranthum f. kanehirae]
MTDRLGEMNEGHELLRRGTTRFATHFVALESLCRAKANIMQIWTLRHVQEVVLGAKFWYREERINYLLEPLVLILKLVDGDTKPTMGYVYDAMDRAKLAIEQRSIENHADVDEFESDQEGQQSPPPHRGSATTREKGKNVAMSSAQGSQRQQRGQSRGPEMTHSTSEQEEEEEERQTSSSSKSGSPKGDQGLNERAYEGSDGGGGEDNIIVYDPLHGGQSEPSGGYGRNEGNEPSEDYGHGHQMASSPWLTDSDSSYGYGQQYYGHSHHDPSHEYGQQYGGHDGPSHG